MHAADLKLVQGMRAGQQRAFDEFYRTYADRLAAFAARRSSLDAANLQDIVQNTLIKAIRNLHGFRGEAALFTWLAHICSNELADARRLAARRPAQSLDGNPGLLHEVEQLQSGSNQEPFAALAARGQQQAVMKALQALPSHYALALEAKYGDGLSVEDIATTLGITPIAAQSLLARAREAFRAQWGDAMSAPTLAEPAS